MGRFPVDFPQGALDRLGQDYQGYGDDDKQDAHRQVGGERFVENQYPDTYGGDRLDGSQYGGKRPADIMHGKYEGDVGDNRRDNRQQDQIGKRHQVGDPVVCLHGSRP